MSILQLPQNTCQETVVAKTLSWNIAVMFRIFLRALVDWLKNRATELKQKNWA